MRARAGRVELALLAVLAAYAFAPLVALIVYVARHGGVLTGVNGTDIFDQFQYLAWIRDEGSHLLASNLWVIGGSAHDYLQPMYLVSGVLWRLGVSVQVAYLVWKPVALIVLFGGCAAFAAWALHGARGGAHGRAGWAAATLLALFYVTPAAPLNNWLGVLSPPHRLQLLLAVQDADAARTLWGFEHTAIAIGLMPVFLIASERVLLARGSPRRAAAAAAVAGALVSWLHPWQGVTLLAVIAALFVVAPPRRRFVALAVPLIATALPLVYGLVLSHSDAYWHSFEQLSTRTGTQPWWALVLSFGPIGLFAALGVRRPASEREWIVLLWVLACAAVYFLVPEFPPHALSGITLPLAVLAVSGWDRALNRVRAPRPAAASLAAAAVLAGTVPAIVVDFQGLGDQLANTISGAISRSQYRLTGDEAAAERYLNGNPSAGGVLAPWLLSMSVPAFTDRGVYAGHPQWELTNPLPADDAFFSPATTAATRRAILRRSGARFVLASCGAPALASVARRVAVFGCVTVYERR